MTLPALQAQITLADVVRGQAAGLRDGAACPWCGFRETRAHQHETWPPRATLVCDTCGTSFAVDRHLATSARKAG